MNRNNKKKNTEFGRRSFMKWAGLSTLGASIGFPLRSKWAFAGESPALSRSSTRWKKRQGF